MHVHEVILSVDTTCPPASGKDVRADEFLDRPVLEPAQEPAIGLVSGSMWKEKRFFVDSSHQKTWTALFSRMRDSRLFHGLPSKARLRKMCVVQTSPHHDRVSELRPRSSKSAAARFQIASRLLKQNYQN